MSQTAYSINMSEGKNGSLADSGDNDILSVINPVGGVALPYGRLAVSNGTEGQAKLPTVATDITTAANVRGVVLGQQNIESDASGDPEHPVGSVVSVLRKGRVYVKVEEAVTDGSDVYVRFAAGGNGLGSFGDTAGAGPDRAILAGARYVKGAAANGLAIVDFNLPA